MYYDSMIAKLIVHGTDRNDAIAKMRAALNGFVIRGISSNIPFQAALLAHPKFVTGDFNTGFIAENYGKGFHAEDVPHADPLFLVALAAFMHRRYRARASGISGQLAGHEVKVGEEFVVVTLGAEGQNQHHEVTVSTLKTNLALALYWWVVPAIRSVAMPRWARFACRAPATARALRPRWSAAWARTRRRCALRTTARRSTHWSCRHWARSCTS
jgi:Acetyl/propionyl-CoA carboxylase, alpha subunit